MISQAAWKSWDLTKPHELNSGICSPLAFLLALTGICLLKVGLREDPQWKYMEREAPSPISYQVATQLEIQVAAWQSAPGSSEHLGA